MDLRIVKIDGLIILKLEHQDLINRFKNIEPKELICSHFKSESFFDNKICWDKADLVLYTDELATTYVLKNRW